MVKILDTLPRQRPCSSDHDPGTPYSSDQALATPGSTPLYPLRLVVVLVYFYDSLIHHSNEDVEGTRHSIVAFTQQNMFGYKKRKEGQADSKMKRLRARKEKIHIKKKK